MTREQIISDLKVHAGRASDEGWHKRALLMMEAALLLEQETPAPSTNKRDKIVLEIDRMDVPMIRHALGIGGNTAMLCSHGKAKARFREYEAVLLPHIPPEAALFEEEAWGELGLALAKAEFFHVTLEPKDRHVKDDWWWDGHLVVTVGEERFATNPWRHPVKRGGPEAENLHRVLAELAPMDCIGSFDNKERT